MYTPSQKILDNYADVLVNFALWSGKGLRKGNTVYLSGNECTKPLFLAVRKAILKAGGHVILNYVPDTFDHRGGDRDLLLNAAGHQLDFFPAKYMKGLVEEIDHVISLLGDSNTRSLEGVDGKKIMRRGLAYQQFMEWRNEKEHRGGFTWTLALYGTPAMAKEAGLSEKAYWDQIIKACFLDEKDPVEKWRQVSKEINIYKNRLNRLSPKIKKLHIFGPDTDLWITPGKERQWLGGGGRNIPSFEIFTSPDWRGTEGWIRFNQPLYRYGAKIEGIELHFKAGKVVKSSAKKNEKLLKAMIATEGADKIGEYSLTDKRFSRITKPMAETLYDENMGGAFGNTHLALGSSFHDCYAGDPSKPTREAWASLGYNESSVHTDIISTAPRTVTAHLTDGSEKIIYQDGQFTL